MAVGYTRISDDREGEAKGVGRQRTDIEAKAKALGWTITEWYEDNDITADPKKKVRPAFQRLMTDMTDGKVTQVLCYDQDRLVRDMRELEDIVDAVEAGSVELTSYNGDMDLRTDNGRMIARIKGAVAKGELEKISRRVKAKIRHDAAAGVQKQGRFRTFGYNRDMTPLEPEATAVREAFKRKASGESLTAIAADFAARGFKTTGGGHWDAATMSKLIRRTSYKGVISLNGEEVGPADFEALVDAATWTLANDNAKPRRGKNTRVSLLAGFVVCGNCYAKMKSGKTKDGPIYRCPGPKASPGACGSCTIGAEKTDEIVLNAAWEKEKEQQAQAPKDVYRDYKKETDQLNDDIKTVRESDLPVGDKVAMLSDLRAKLKEVQVEEADSMLDALVQEFGYMPAKEWPLDQKRLWIERYVDYVVIAKADRVGIKGYKPHRLTIHFQDETIESGSAYTLEAKVAKSAVVDSHNV